MLLPDLGISAPSVVARILAWALDETDFRPSRSGLGGACASGRTVWGSSRERWRDVACCYRTSGFRPPRSWHAYWRGRSTRPIFDHREAEVHCAGGRAQAASVSASDGAPAHAVCTLPRFGKLALQLEPAHALTNATYLCTLMTPQTVRDSSKDCSHGQLGRLTRECRARATCRVHTRTRSGTSTSCNESRPLALRDEEIAGAVTRDPAQQMNAGAI
jgi:hypothetical protein